MKAALVATGLALGFAAPLAAQEADPAPAANAAAEAVELSASGPIVLVSGPDKLLSQFGTAPIDPDAELCLRFREEALLVSDRATIQLSGGGCFTASVAEREAFEAEQRALEGEALEAEQRVLEGEALVQATVAYDAAIASGDAAAIDQAFEKLQAVMQIVAAENSRREATAERERQAAIDEGNSRAFKASLVAAGRIPRMARGVPRAEVPLRPIIFRLASASPAVLQRYPKGTLVQRTTSLCLQNGEQATILGSHGQSVTYTGPGCLKRQAKPTAANIGGFTFG